ncbi:hypothetical protein SOM10_11955 [Microbacterium sp. CFBP9023]|uniref:hypothetical protein n=1 Tax=Microbacterium sp. CFBP9023 TaxID=3096535 RepID=UPI002A6A8845|nr:hypothetical protein [Microbacterium sp. CFBP9023]MDY0984609.1 hypothetical protein [Microbacterium sp. CFBP9023]
MSEYTPTEARICIDFCNAATKRAQADGSFMSMEEADAAFSRWLVAHDAEVRAIALKDAEEAAATALNAWWRTDTGVDGDTDSVLDVRRAVRALRSGVGAEKPAPMMLVDEREPECVKAWPGCYTFGHDPACCRFPKSCSAGEVRMVPVKQEGATDA